MGCDGSGIYNIYIYSGTTSLSFNLRFFELKRDSLNSIFFVAIKIFQESTPAYRLPFKEHVDMISNESFRFYSYFLLFVHFLNRAMASRAGLQRTARCAHVGYIVKKLVSRLSTPQHQKRMITTNRLLPVGSLKRRCLKQLFSGWVNRKFKGEGRILTKKVASTVVRLLRSQLELPPCHDVSEEIKRMHYFLKTARKRLSVKPKMASVDEMETLPLVAETLQQDEWYTEDWSFFF